MTSRMSQGFQMIQDIFKLRWIPEIIAAISEGHENYNDILRVVEGISNTELNRKLAVLVDKKAVIKAPLNSKSRYSLTDFGYDLNHIFSHFEEMSSKYLTEASH